MTLRTMPLNILYKVEFFNTITGFWEKIQDFSQESYPQAITKLYDLYKFNNSNKYRLIKVEESLIDILYPPGS